MNTQLLDVLAFAAHPDDAEISAGGTLSGLVRRGKKVGIIDLTRGELGSRGSAELRDLEAKRASEILGISLRDNLAMSDGFFAHDQAHLSAIVEQLRAYRPDIVLANSVTDRHPDHGRAGKLVADACFLAGLPKVISSRNGAAQKAWRPRAVYHFIQDYFIEPHFVVDVTNDFDKKMEAIQAYSSQFYQPGSDDPSTPISGPEFFEFLKARAMQFGRPIGALYGEGFTSGRYLGVSDLTELL